MFARDVEEMVWHFVGYIHMADVTAKARHSYDVYRLKRSTEEEEWREAELFSPREHEVDQLDSAPAWAHYVPQLWVLNYSPDEFFAEYARLHADVEGEIARFGSPRFWQPVFPQVPQSESEFTWQDGELKITITYSDGGNGEALFNIHQYNFLSSQSMLTFGKEGSVWDFHDGDALDQTLDKSFAQLGVWMPHVLFPEEQTPQAFIDMVLAHSAARAEDGPDQAPSLPPFVQSVGSGIYINREMQQQDEAEEDTLADNGTSNGSVEMSPLDMLTEDANQKLSLGGNLSVNIASVIDFSESMGSSIIQGDYYKLDGIFQFNIYQGATHITTDAFGLVYDNSAAKSVADSVAAFANDNQLVYGNAALGALPGLNWNVHIHDGDFWNITTIYQQNWLMTENFAAHVSQGWGSDVKLGYNEQLNITEIEYFGFDYDLIVVLGNKYDYSLIFQTNVIINENIIFLLVDDDVEAGVKGGGNELMNEAAIANYGNDLFKAMTPEVEALVQLLAEQQKSITIDELFFEFASTLPGNGTNEFNILFVTGDYYKLTLIDQVNVIIDMNVGIQAPSDHDNGFEGDSWAQFVEAGGNTAINLAAIINVNSTSEFQYLGGDKYHDMLLLQEEMVAEDYQLVYKDTQKLVPEVIAFLEAPEEENEDGYPVWTENQAGQDEGFSGVLT